jgi:hypothetical protein
MALVWVQGCESFATDPETSALYCANLEWHQTYLIPPEAAGYVDILVSGGFSPEAFGIGFVGVLSVFITGLAVGWIASLLRKAR